MPKSSTGLFFISELSVTPSYVPQSHAVRQAPTVATSEEYLLRSGSHSDFKFSLQMMKAVSGAWLILFVTLISTWILCSYAVAPTDLSLPILTAPIGSTDGGGEKVIHKSTGAQGGRGAGGGGSISDRPEAVRKSSGSKLLIANNLFTLVMAAPLAVHLF